MSELVTNNIVAVVVTYRPNIDTLAQLVSALTMQVKSIIIVDNGSYMDLDICNIKSSAINVEVLLLNENQGIAAAHNLGIKQAKNYHANYVLLMDQDSVPASDMVEKLLNGILEVKSKSNLKPIAAGPTCIDSRTNKRYFFVIERYFFPTRWHIDEKSSCDIFPFQVSALISSGTLIDLKGLENVGGMRSNYFIDHVDTEWSFRAKAKGYVLLGVPNALMQHTLGDKIANIWFFGWLQVAYHSPLRDYYMFRNTLLILRDVKISFFMSQFLLWRLFKFIVYFLIFAPQRFQRFNFMALGVVHGLYNIRGKLDVKTSKCTLIPISDIDPN